MTKESGCKHELREYCTKYVYRCTQCNTNQIDLAKLRGSSFQ